MTNEFAEAVKPRTDIPTHKVDHPHFYQHLHEAQALQAKARNMTRQELFNNGFITVEDLDDEELRRGQCRDAHGRFPKITKTMESVPRDLYDAMVAEHAQRFDEKLRQQLDVALNTLAEVMVDPTAEPKDKMEAAKWFVDRVRGKTVERVDFHVRKEPWEELLGDVAHITYQQHKAIQSGAIIDAEVVEDPIQSPVPAVHGEGLGDHDGPEANPLGQHGLRTPEAAEVDASGTQDHGVPDRGDVAVGATGEHGDSSGHGGGDLHGSGLAFVDHDPNSPFQPVPEAPSFNNLARSNPVAPQSLSEQIREAQAEAVAVAEARAARKQLIDGAKRRRKAMRATGADVLRRKVDPERMAKVQERLVSEDEHEIVVTGDDE